jgi:hypothetical protein
MSVYAGRSGVSGYVSNAAMSPGLARALAVAGTLVVAWGMLLLLTLGPTLVGIAAWVFFAVCGVAIIRGESRAVGMSWLATAMMATAAAAERLSPVLVFVLCGFFVLAMFLSDRRGDLQRQ